MRGGLPGMNERFKLSKLDLLTFALEGVNTTIGTNTGNPDWTREDWEFHYRAQKEIERRIKIVKAQGEQG
jgi:hypothetical protein